MSLTMFLLTGVCHSVAGYCIAVFICLQCYWKTVTDIVIKLSEYKGNDIRIIPLNLSGSSALQWGVG